MTPPVLSYCAPVVTVSTWRTCPRSSLSSGRTVNLGPPRLVLDFVPEIVMATDEEVNQCIEEVMITKAKVQTAIVGLRCLLESLDEQLSILKKKKSVVDAIHQTMRKSLGIEEREDIVTVNIRGQMFEIQIENILKYEWSYLSTYFLYSPTSWIFVDCSPIGLHILCQYLQTGRLDFRTCTSYEIENILNLIKYLRIPLPYKEWDYSQVRTVEQENGHSSTIYRVIELQDGRICTCSWDEMIKVWSLETFACELTLAGHTRPVYSVCQLQNSLLCSGSSDNTIKVWDLLSGACIRTLYNHTGAIDQIVQLQDGRFLTSSWDKTIKVWNSLNFECEMTLQGHEDSITCLLELHDGRLASGSWDKHVRLWNLGTYECEGGFHTNALVHSVVQLHDGRICCCLGNREIQVWRLDPLTLERSVPAHRDWVISSVVLADGRLCTGGGILDCRIRIWNTESWECEKSLQGTAENEIWSLVQLRDGRICSSSREKAVKIWS